MKQNGKESVKIKEYNFLFISQVAVPKGYPMGVNFKVPAHAAMMAGVLMKRKVLRNLCKNGTINLNTDQIDGKIAVF